MKRKLFALLPLLVALSAHAEKTSFDLSKLKLPEGFHVAVFASDMDGARMLTFTPGGALLVSESGEGKVVALPDPKHTGKASRVVEVLTGLNEPHGIAFYEGKLYVAENDKVRRYDWDEAQLRATNPQEAGRSANRRRPLHAQPSVSRRQDVYFRWDQAATCASRKTRGARR